MTDLVSDPPPSFAAALNRFQVFLLQNNYPQKVGWLLADDFLIDGRGHIWINRNGPARGLQEAQQQYAVGLERNLGILLEAVCASDSITFARVFVPTDKAEAQNRLIGRCLKSSCPVDKVHAHLVDNPIRWHFLRLRNKKRTQKYQDCWW